MIFRFFLQQSQIAQMHIFVGKMSTMRLNVAKRYYSDLPPPEPEPEGDPFLLDAGDPLAEPDPDLEPDRDLAVPESDPLGDRDIDFDCDLGEIVVS